MYLYFKPTPNVHANNKWGSLRLHGRLVLGEGGRAILMLPWFKSMAWGSTSLNEGEHSHCFVNLSHTGSSTR